jgi:hypothetical protein
MERGYGPGCRYWQAPQEPKPEMNRPGLPRIEKPTPPAPAKDKPLPPWYPRNQQPPKK